MINLPTETAFLKNLQISTEKFLWGFVFILIASFSVFAQVNLSQPDDKTLIVEDSKGTEIISFGKTVIIKKEAKGVFTFGGDVIVEGNVEGDVASIGGNVIQKEGAFIGGDIIIIGGTYKPESEKPLRNAEKETVVVAAFESFVRNISQNPAQLFSPSFSWSFLGFRLLLVLFWFVVSLLLTTIAPGAVSRAVARLQLSTLKIFAIGFFGFLITIFCVIASTQFLPTYLSAIVFIAALLLLVVSYVFGRVALQMSIGKMLQKKLLPEKFQSETLALFTGVIVWAILLAIPYLWAFALLMLFSASIGLVLTGRAGNAWQKK